MGMCRKHGSQIQPFSISMTPYFFYFGISMGRKFADFRRFFAVEAILINSFYLCYRVCTQSNPIPICIQGLVSYHKTRTGYGLFRSLLFVVPLSFTPILPIVHIHLMSGPTMTCVLFIDLAILLTSHKREEI